MAPGLDLHRHRPEVAAAVTSGLLVLVLPIAFRLLSGVFENTDTSVTVRPPMSIERLVLGASRTAVSLLVSAPFAAVAAWRTWVHALRWRAGLGAGAQGIFEAGLTGLIPMVLYLLPGIVARPIEALPFVMAYGGMAFLAGLVVGVVLRTTAIAVLAVTAWALHESSAA